MHNMQSTHLASPQKTMTDFNSTFYIKFKQVPEAQHTEKKSQQSKVATINMAGSPMIFSPGSPVANQ